MGTVTLGVEPARRGSRRWLLLSAVCQFAVGFLYLLAPILAPHGVVLVLRATWMILTLGLFLSGRNGVGKALLLVPAATLLLWFGILAGAQLVVGPFTA